MEANRRSIGRGVLLLGAVTLLGRQTWATGNRTSRVSVAPAPGSTLDADDAQVTAVRGSLLPLILSEPNCSAGEVENQLREDFPDRVDDSTYPTIYVWYVINGKWVHYCENLTELVVDFGSGRTVLVSVVESELKPI